MTSCPNCGAPFTGTVCQYCGTRLSDILRIPDGTPVMLSWERDGTRYTVKFLMDSMCARYDRDEISVYSDGDVYCTLPGISTTRMSFEGVCVPFEWKVGDETKTVYTIQEDVAR